MTDVTAPTNDLTEIAIILDRSGSMHSIKERVPGSLSLRGTTLWSLLRRLLWIQGPFS